MIRFKMLLSVIGVAAFAQAACSDVQNPANLQSQSNEVYASSELVNDEITQTIANEMSKKCGTLFSDSTDKLERCSKAASHMARLLDFKYVKNNSGQSAFVFMNSKLTAMLDDEKVIKFLSQLQNAAEDALYLDKPFNLWDFALASSEMNPEKATERLAVLIQDGAETAAQIKYLFVVRHPQAMLLYSAVQALEAALREKKAVAYPASLNNSRTALYHYYVPRYLAQELKRTQVGSEMSALLPVMFNASYELHQIQKMESPETPLNHKPVTISEDLSPETKKFVQKWNRYDELFSDLLDHLSAPLKSYDHTQQSFNNDDIFLGYAGAIGGVRPSAIPRAKVEFISSFAQNPVQTLRHNIQ
jgi:hypothetical protein